MVRVKFIAIKQNYSNQPGVVNPIIKVLNDFYVNQLSRYASRSKFSTNFNTEFMTLCNHVLSERCVFKIPLGSSMYFQQTKFLLPD